MSTYDLIVRGGYVVDGTGLPRGAPTSPCATAGSPRSARLDGDDAREELDADGLIVAPGVVDVHTHYDPQITFEPLATMSSYHGVTTVLAGNCGFSIAPSAPRDRDFVAAHVRQGRADASDRRMSAIKWDFETFPEYLAAREGKLGINFACYVGHSNMRRWVMGDDGSDARRDRRRDRGDARDRRATRCAAAPPACRRRTRRRTSTATTGRCRRASPTHEELLALCAAAGEAGAGHDRATCRSAPSAASTRTTRTPHPHRRGQRAARRHPGPRRSQQGRRADGHVGARASSSSTAPPPTARPCTRCSSRGRPTGRCVSTGNFHFLAVPVVGPHAAAAARRTGRAAARRRGARRAARRRSRTTTATRPRARRRLRRCGRRSSSTTSQSAEHRGYDGAHDRVDRRKSWASHRPTRCSTSRSPRTSRPSSAGDWETDEWRSAVAEAQLDYRMVVGVSDGGAHLARDDGADWSSWFIAQLDARARGVELEEGIRQLTAVARRARRLRRPRRARGRASRRHLRVRSRHRSAPGRKEFVHDLPGRRRPLQGRRARRQGDHRQRRAGHRRRLADRRAARAHGAPVRAP